MEVASPLPHQALVDGAVLGVDGDELTRGHERHEQVAADDERLLVGVEQGLAGLERRVARVDARKADDRGDDAVHVVAQADLLEGVVADEKVAARGQRLERGVLGVALVGDGNDPGAVALGRARHELGRAADGEADDLYLVGVLTADVERLHSDGAGCPEHHDANGPLAARRWRRVLKDVQAMPPRWRMTYATMHPKSMESDLSSRPP